jgi:hypothetical protein
MSVPFHSLRNFLVVSLIVLCCSCSQGDQTVQLEWVELPRHPGYSLEEQIRIAQTRAPNLSIFQDENVLSEDNVEFLIRLAEQKLKYGDLTFKTPDELILITTHLTGTIGRTNHLAKISILLSTDRREENASKLFRKTLLSPSEWDIPLLWALARKNKREILERSQAEVERINSLRNNDIVDEFIRRKKPVPLVCGNYTLIAMGIFNAFKERFPQLADYEFVPVTAAEINHAWQSVVNTRTGMITMFDAFEDDKDGKFITGPYGLLWRSGDPDFFYSGYSEYVLAILEMDEDPHSAIARLRVLQSKYHYPEAHLLWTKAKAYLVLDDQETAKVHLNKINNSIYMYRYLRALMGDFSI